MSKERLNKPSTTFRAETWDEERFSKARDDWHDLLSRSNADPLFMSWDWQYLWWDSHHRALSLELRLIAVYDASRLVALLPFTRRQVSHRGLFMTRRLELLGNVWRHPEAVISEYLDIIVDSGCEAGLLDWLPGYLCAGSEFDEVIVANVKPTSLVVDLMSGIRAQVGSGYLRQTDVHADYGADISSGFAAYIATLQSAARRKMYAHRPRLEAPQLNVVSAKEFPAAFDMMCEFLASRWGKKANQDMMQVFYSRLAARMSELGCLQFSVLYSDGAPVSVMYNVRVDRVEYNIQSAFRPGGSSGLTLTYLHFGYSIESACENNIDRFLLLAGRGKTRDYKKDIASQIGTVSTVQLLRGRVAGLLYRGYDRLRRSEPTESGSGLRQNLEECSRVTGSVSENAHG